MKLLIKETNEIKELRCIDPKTGVCWLGEIMEQYDAIKGFEIDAGNGAYVISGEDYDWWEGYAANWERDEQEMLGLVAEYDGAAVYRIYGEHMECVHDLEDEHAAKQAAAKEVRETLSA